MVEKINKILKEVLNELKVSDNETREIRHSVGDFIGKLKEGIKKYGFDAEVFSGGSFAKGTMMKKKISEVDIFIRFGKRHKDSISKMTESLLKGFKKMKIHGSRDYFKISAKENLILEVIPVVKVKKPEAAENITDLSFFHVGYVKRNFPKKIFDEIILAKAFCHASGCYGAESYIHGFSGYGIELLLYRYGSFLKFIREISKIGLNEKKVIDIEKKFKNRQQVLMDINGAKLQSPIVLVDPTYRQRNALAALSNETFLKFQKYCKAFLRNPSEKFFEKREIDFSNLREQAKKRKLEFIKINAITDRQSGDVAGSKLLKFYSHLSSEIGKNYEIKIREFSYKEGTCADYAFGVKSKKEVIHNGPRTSDKDNVRRFKKKHKRTFVKNQRIYSKEKVKSNVKKFVSDWKGKNKDRLKEMHVTKLEIV